VTKPPHRIVFANEKGGTGKSTTAVHVAVALAYRGAKVAAIDLDPRQRTLYRYFENRRETERRRRVDLPGADFAVFDGGSVEELETAVEELANGDLAGPADFVIFDSPGRDDPLARHAATRADTLVTPMNDSFVDLDLLARIDPDGLKIVRPSIYAEAVWKQRQLRAMQGGRPIDWIVVRNRLSNLAARNKRDMLSVLQTLSKRIGFRLAAGLNERVIYRELFLRGLTLLDLREYKTGVAMTMSHVAARQEVRDLLEALNLPHIQRTPAPPEAPEAEPEATP
jgi:chromosome partitioning protein